MSAPLSSHETIVAPSLDSIAGPDPASLLFLVVSLLRELRAPVDIRQTQALIAPHQHRPMLSSGKNVAVDPFSHTAAPLCGRKPAKPSRVVPDEKAPAGSSRREIARQLCASLRSSRGRERTS